MFRHTARARTGQNRTGLYQEITDKIIAELEAGRAPWVQPWGTAAAKAPLGLPRNACTQRRYSGINVLILWGAVIEHGFAGQSWLTFRQALSLGGHVRKGERGTTVVYADRFTPDDERRRAAETGEEAQAIPFLKRFTVFNTAQCESLPDEMVAMAPPVETDLVLPQAEALIRATGVDFRIGGERAFYDPRHDFVQVPPPQAYFEPINWHRTALHEIGHASGHSSRLNRDLTGSFGSKKYAFEELIAEISAAYLCASLNITPTVRHADYIGSWLDVLREDNRAIVRAASAASKAADYILGFQSETPEAGAAIAADDEREAALWYFPPVGFSRNAEPDIRALAFPAFRVCGPPRVRGLRRFRDEVGSRERLSTARHGETDMATTIQKIILSTSRDIPFNKLVLSQANVRRVKAGVSIEELAEDIARRTLLQGLSVRAVVDADGTETGMFEVPAGGRRFRALELLVKQKRLAKTAPVPCVVREGGIAEEDSLAENVQRVALHPLDQFRAFQALREKGLGDDEIAARFFVNPTVVKQRLRLAAVSPKLLDIYAEDGMTLEQLMAFTVTTDHARQEQVWESVSRSYNKEPYLIRRQLTEGAVRAADRRALFVGADVYEAAGGVVMRDLFQHDDGGWLQDPALLDRLVTEKLQAEAEGLRDEGWKWIAVATDFPYGHSAGLRRLVGETAELTEEEAASFDALRTEYETLEAEHAGGDDLPEAVDQRLGEIETAMAAFENRPIRFDPADIARAGIFVSIDSDGALRVERGFVRPEDEAPVAPVPTEADDTPEPTSTEIPVQRAVITIGGAPSASEPEAPEEDDTIRPLSDRLVTELTAHRTLALRDGVANDPQVAFQAVLHALCLNAFYRYAASTCLEITAKQSGFSAQAPGLAETVSAKAIDARHAQWAKQLPETPADLWDTLTAFDSDSQSALFAHCASLTVNVVKEPWNRRPDAFAHGDQLAHAVGLDMVAAGWKPTVDSYLGRVPKARILEAVREAKGEHSAQLIDHLKKTEMAKEAERLLDGTGWLPEPLRLAGCEPAVTEPDGEAEALPNFLAGEEEAADPEAAEPHAIAAE